MQARSAKPVAAAMTTVLVMTAPARKEVAVVGPAAVEVVVEVGQAFAKQV